MSGVNVEIIKDQKGELEPEALGDQKEELEIEINDVIAIRELVEQTLDAVLNTKLLNSDDIGLYEQKKNHDSRKKLNRICSSFLGLIDAYLKKKIGLLSTADSILDTINLYNRWKEIFRVAGKDYNILSEKSIAPIKGGWFSLNDEFMKLSIYHQSPIAAIWYKYDHEYELERLRSNRSIWLKLQPETDNEDLDHCLQFLPKAFQKRIQAAIETEKKAFQKFLKEAAMTEKTKTVYNVKAENIGVVGETTINNSPFFSQLDNKIKEARSEDDLLEMLKGILQEAEPDNPEPSSELNKVIEAYKEDPENQKESLFEKSATILNGAVKKFDDSVSVLSKIKSIYEKLDGLLGGGAGKLFAIGLKVLF